MLPPPFAKVMDSATHGVTHGSHGRDAIFARVITAACTKLLSPCAKSLAPATCGVTHGLHGSHTILASARIGPVLIAPKLKSAHKGAPTIIPQIASQHGSQPPTKMRRSGLDLSERTKALGTRLPSSPMGIDLSHFLSCLSSSGDSGRFPLSRTFGRADASEEQSLALSLSNSGVKALSVRGSRWRFVVLRWYLRSSWRRLGNEVCAVGFLSCDYSLRCLIQLTFYNFVVYTSNFTTSQFNTPFDL